MDAQQGHVVNVPAIFWIPADVVKYKLALDSTDLIRSPVSNGENVPQNAEKVPFIQQQSKYKFVPS